MIKQVSLTLVSLLVAAGGLGLASEVHACDCGHSGTATSAAGFCSPGPAHGGCVWDDLHTRGVKTRELTQDQRAQITALERRYAKSLEPLATTLARSKAELDAYTASEQATVEGIKQRRAEMRKLQGEVEDLQLDAAAAVREILPDAKGFAYPSSGASHTHGGYSCDGYLCSGHAHDQCRW